MLAVGQRNARDRSRRHSRSYAWDDLKRDPSLGQGLFFLTATAKNQRIPTLEPDHMLALRCFAHQNCTNFRLRRPMSPRSFAHVDLFNPGRAHFQQFRVG